LDLLDRPRGEALRDAPVTPADDLPPWGWRECLLGVIAAIASLAALFTVVAVVAGAFGTADGDSAGYILFGLAATVVLEACLFGIAVRFTAGRYPGGLRLLGWRFTSPSEWIGWSGLAVVLAWATLLGYVVLLKALKLDDLVPQSNVPKGVFDHRETVALAVLLTVVAAPIVEETFFRGFLFGGLRRRLGFAGAATISGALFALAHFSPTLIIPFTLIGVVFAFTYWRTGTLLASITAHMTFNLVSVLGALATTWRH
jgi:membrane protease YdiL (CAAX protease family)